MAKLDSARLAPLFFTGTSPFLVANPHFALAMSQASRSCALHASESIFDANGLLLWASGRAIDERLLERLQDRVLRKPVELCVRASGQEASGWLVDALEETLSRSDDLEAIVIGHWDAIRSVVACVSPNPTELMLLSVLRHGGEDRLRHATLVCASTLAFAVQVEVHPELLRPLALAALLHDVGELYLPAERERTTPADLRRHPMIGARVAVELAHSLGPVSRFIASSHERLDGWGYPQALTREQLSLPEQALLLAEAIAPALETGENRLRRAAITTRLVPGEFHPAMVGRIATAARGRGVENPYAALACPVSLELKQVHSVIEVIASMLADAPGESGVAREHAARWAQKLESLRRVLNATGVAEEVASGHHIEPQDLNETIELIVLCDELRARIRELRQRVELAQEDVPELGASGLVLQLLEALRASEPDPHAFAAGDAGATMLRWSPMFSVGVREIDEQHRTLVDLLNRLHAASGAAGNETGLRDDILQRLVAYVGEHFATEERLMLAGDYPDIAAHLAEHNYLKDRVTELIARKGTGAPRLDELTLFLRGWLVSHILQTDKALGKALNAQGVH